MKKIAIKLGAFLIAITMVASVFITVLAKNVSEEVTEDRSYDDNVPIEKGNEDLRYDVQPKAKIEDENILQIRPNTRGQEEEMPSIDAIVVWNQWNTDTDALEIWYSMYGHSVATPQVGGESEWLWWDGKDEATSSSSLYTDGVNNLPRAVMDRNGNALVVWLHDLPGECPSNEIRWKFWNGLDWSYEGSIIPTTTANMEYYEILSIEIAMEYSGIAIVLWEYSWSTSEHNYVHGDDWGWDEYIETGGSGIDYAIWNGQTWGTPSNVVGGETYGYRYRIYDNSYSYEEHIQDSMRYELGGIAFNARNSEQSPTITMQEALCVYVEYNDSSIRREEWDSGYHIILQLDVDDYTQEIESKRWDGIAFIQDEQLILSGEVSQYCWELGTVFEMDKTLNVSECFDMSSDKKMTTTVVWDYSNGISGETNLWSANWNGDEGNEDWENVGTYANYAFAPAIAYNYSDVGVSVYNRPCDIVCSLEMDYEWHEDGDFALGCGKNNTEVSALGHNSCFAIWGNWEGLIFSHYDGTSWTSASKIPGSGSGISPPTRGDDDIMGYDIDAAAKASSPNAPLAEWTLMVYQAGDNDLGSEIYSDLLELQKVGSTPSVNVVTLYNAGEDDFAPYYYIKKDGVELKKHLEAPNNLGDSDILSNFIKWSMEEYPASRYMLAIDSQGSGWRTLATDWKSNDMLTLKEFGDALDDALSEDIKLDIVLFDTPYSASVEIAYEAKDHVDYMVASEDIVPDGGWPYDKIIQVLNDDVNMVTEDITKELLNEYHNHHNPGGEDYAVSALRLSGIGDFTTAIDNFAANFFATYNGGTTNLQHRLKLAVATALRPPTGNYANFVTTPSVHKTDPSFVDAYRFFHWLSNTLGTGHTAQKILADKVREEFPALLIDKKSSDFLNKPMEGVNIYLPFCSIREYEHGEYQQISFAVDLQWDDFLDRACPEHSVYFRNYNAGVAPIDWNWRGNLIKGGWDLYQPPKDPVTNQITKHIMNYMKTHQRTVPWVCGQAANQVVLWATLQHVRVTYLTHDTFSDDRGYFMFPSNPMIRPAGGVIAPSGQITVSLEDRGRTGAGATRYIQVIDCPGGVNVADRTFGDEINTRDGLVNGLFCRADFWTVGGNDRDFAVIYHHTMEAVEFALQILVLELDDLTLPVEILAHSPFPGTFYNPPTSVINIEHANGGSDYRIKPDNREWHEFSHHIMKDSLIGIDNAMPNRANPWDVQIDDNLNDVFDENPPVNPMIIAWNPPGAGSREGPYSLIPHIPPGNIRNEINHWGYVNPTTTDSWAEGFAEFFSCVIADCFDYPNPWIYEISYAVDLETGYRTWQHRTFLFSVLPPPHNNRIYLIYPDEELAVASIMWDIYDDNTDTDNRWGINYRDDINLHLDRLWDTTNRITNTDVNAIYNAFAYLNGADSDGDGMDDLDEIFVNHGAFGDTAPFELFNGIGGGEVIGFCGYDRALSFLSPNDHDLVQDDEWRYDYNGNGFYDPPNDFNVIGECYRRALNVNRNARPPIPDSCLLLSAFDTETGEQIEELIMTVEIRYDHPFHSHDFIYEMYVNLAELVDFEMPCPDFSSTAIITPYKDSYEPGEPLIIDSNDFYDIPLDAAIGYKIEHTFYLDPITPSLFDFGDALDPVYPSRLANNGARHLDITYEWLGESVDAEEDSNQFNMDNFDDGVLIDDLTLTPWTTTTVPFTVTVNDRNDPNHPYDAEHLLYVNMLFDWNEEGGWEGSIVGSGGEAHEWAVRNFAIDVSQWPEGVTSKIIESPPFLTGPLEELFWTRITLTYDQPISDDDWNGQGLFDYGETEDYGPLECDPTPPEPCTQTISISIDWNLISIAVGLDSLGTDYTASAFAGEINEQAEEDIIKYVVRYDNEILGSGFFEEYVVDSGIGTDFPINEGEGYYLYSISSFEMEFMIVGDCPEDETFDLIECWNLVGYRSMTEMDVGLWADMIDEYAGEPIVQAIVRYYKGTDPLPDDDYYDAWYPGDPDTEFQVKPGEAYWIFSATDITGVPYPA